MLRARGRVEEFGQVSVVGGLGEEAMVASGDRGAVGGDVPAGDGQAQEVAQEFLALPGRVDLPAVGHVRLRCWRACARACSKRAQAVAATVGDDGTSGTTGSPFHGGANRTRHLRPYIFYHIAVRSRPEVAAVDSDMNMLHSHLNSPPIRTRAPPLRSRSERRPR